MRTLKRFYFLFFISSLTMISSCNNNRNTTNFEKEIDSVPNAEKTDIPKEQVDLFSTQTMIIKHEYNSGKDSSKHWKREIVLPAIGKFVQEAHYVTTLDSFPNNRLFANEVTENIENHLKRSFDIYRLFDTKIGFNELFNNKWKREWTPAESGKIGQGCVGNIQKQELSPDLELWMMNMMWAKGQLPKRGTKFLMSYNDKKVVVISGYERGPSQEMFLGGVTCEVHTWLGTDRNSQIKIEYLNNQYVAVGPIK